VAMLVLVPRTVNEVRLEGGDLTVQTVNQIRLKGGGLTVHRNRAGNIQVLGDNDTIRAGDALRIVLSLTRPDSVAVWFVDAQGRVDRILPAEITQLPSGEHALPGSAVVETPCLDLWIVGAPGADASIPTEMRIRTAFSGGVPSNDNWPPASVIVRRLRCE